MEMVKYWKKMDSAPAKVITNKDGELVMQIQGEKYPSPGFPRTFFLFGALSKLKHEIKNQIFNDSWYALERGESKEQVIARIKKILLDGIKVRDTSPIAGVKYNEGDDLLEICKNEMLPPDKLYLPVREIWRAMTTLEKRHLKNRYIGPLKKIFTLIFQEDDSYRFRLLWIIQIFNPSAWWFFFDPIEWFEKALCELENGEVVGDMQERIRLLRRILLLLLEDKGIRSLFLELCREMNWNKLKMSKADKYFFRAKYFFVDLDRFEK